jgi:peptidoglycan/xylan/chitin deacetylase (PgdA/CDA1 family)
MTSQPGYFLFSLDTELAYGWFDRFDPARFSPDGSRERAAVQRLLALFDRYQIRATWAVVGHMMFERCEDCECCPLLAWRGKYPVFEKIYHTDQRLWYGHDIVEALRARSNQHEIGFHGYTHEIFNEGQMTPEQAAIEIREWQRVADRFDIHPTTVIFPRNRVGHLALFKAAGYTCYRGAELLPPDYYRIPLWGKAMNRLDLKLQFRTPQVYQTTIDRSGLVNLPASRWIFRIDRRYDRMLDALNLTALRMAATERAIHQAARQGKIVHIWAHPEEFTHERDFMKLEIVLKAATQEINQGRMVSMTMAQMAEVVRHA